MFEVVHQGAVHVITGNEPVNETTVPDLRDVLEHCLTASQPRIVFDLEHVPLFDSVGLEWLLDASDECASRTGVLELAAPNQLCRDVLDITRVGQHFTLFEDVNAAVRSFAQ